MKTQPSEKKTKGRFHRLPRRQLDRIISHFPKQKILVFGDVGVDKYTIGQVNRISPEAPIPIVEVTDTKLKLGLAANVADNIAALGGEPLLVGLLGKDHPSQDFISLLGEHQISDRYLVRHSLRKTTVKERVVAEAQQVVRIDHETRCSVDVKLLRQVWSKLEKILDQAHAVIIEDYAKGLIEPSLCHQLIEAAEQRGLPVFVDPNSKSSLGLYFGCTVMTPNTTEAEALSGIKIVDLPTLRQAGYKLLDQVNARHVIITRGRDGMAIFSRGQTEPVLIPTFAREVFDVSGAGDTTIATLALALVSGANLIEAALLANSAAGVVVGKRGTATVTRPELKAYVEFLNQQPF